MGLEDEIYDTPPKTNMEPENGPLEKEIAIGNHHFLIFWGVFPFGAGALWGRGFC